MLNYTLYRKEIAMLEIVKTKFLAREYHGGYRESINELFFDNNARLRQEFLEIVPIQELEKTKELLWFISNITYSSKGHDGDKLGVPYHNDRYVRDIIADISKLQELISKECNKRFHYGVFYSWQSDTDEKRNRNFIEEVLKKSIKEVNKYATNGPLLGLDKDTRGVPGSPDIVNTIMQKIERSVCFVADVTPIGILSNKKVVNPNVMFEVGYALSVLGYERVILISNTAFGELKELPFDLGLKRVIAYNYNTDVSDSEKKNIRNNLTARLKESIMAISDY